MNQSLTDFVHLALARGISRQEISGALEKGGWDSKEISAALDGFVDTGLPVPVPRKRVSSSPKDAFLFLMLFSALYTAAFALGSVLFDLINLYLPLPGESRMPWIFSLRWGISATVVSFPVFLLMSGLIARETARNPGQRISPVRRWLTYLTLFVASISIVADLIALILRFLEGDITARFGLKVLVAGVLAGTAFWYYLQDLHRDEVAPSAEVRRGRVSAFAWTALVAVVLAALGMGVWQAGAPGQARLLAQDHQRVQDLQDIAARVQRHYVSTGSLPASLDACDDNPNTYVNHRADRVTAKAYEYRVIDATHFEVAAEFAAASAPGEDMRNDAFWKHGPGRQVFRIDATRRDRLN
jgi:hypothetical protein